VRAYLLSLALVAALVLLLLRLQSIANDTTVALVLLLSVLVSAALFGSRVGGVSALAAALAFNFFFLPPVGTLRLEDPLNWIALAVFLAVGIVAGELSSRARHRADEAEASRREAERLYAELQEAFSREARAEAFRQSEELKSALLDAVTHNLRTPITSIKASATALQADDTSALDAASRRELISVVGEEADRLNTMVEDLIGLAKIEAGNFRLTRRWCSLEDVVSGAAARIDQERRLRVGTNLLPDLPLVYADARALEEIVYQLLDNALKYSPPASPVLVSASAVPNERVAIAVDDRGPGVPEHERERVFEKFYRGDHATGAGLGMGLAIARGLARAHNGDLIVTAHSDGPGVRFLLTLPIGDDDMHALRNDPPPNPRRR
jgi:K+-sensing histidine kinase KdpD